MKLFKDASELYERSPDALRNTTDICICAHQDDIEIMAYAPISDCFGSRGRRFTGVVVSDGAGSPRTGLYESYTDEKMKRLRAAEQKLAADIGDFAALALLAFESGEIKDPANKEVVNDIRNVLLASLPETVYTHNPADKHDTHVAVCLRVIAAIRALPADKRPKRLYGMEVWRGLDWLRDEDKAVFDTSKRPNLAAALLGVFDSQISGGKRYDLAAISRRTANATFYESHETDSSDSVSFGLDMSALINNETLGVQAFIKSYIKGFADEVNARLARFC